VLFRTWIPCNAGGYAFTFVVIVLIGIFNGLLKGLRARQEQLIMTCPVGAWSPPHARTLEALSMSDAASEQMSC
jgi:hypothetical protein